MAGIAKNAARNGLKIGLVPTMGALHEGHLSLVRKARTMADRVAVSIFVNPTQFGMNEDFDRYPRALPADAQLLAREGVDYIFAPSTEELYPAGFATWVTVDPLSSKLCGVSRPDHFRGVSTIVAKLLNIVRPTFAFFGQKDAQQTIIIQRMVADLNLDTQVVVCPTVREADGLALSSRNRYLNPQERQAATVLIRALEDAGRLIQEGERDIRRIKEHITRMIAAEPLVRIDYVALTNRQTLEPIPRLEGEVLIALAVFIGNTRLIDNKMFSVAA